AAYGRRCWGAGLRAWRGKLPEAGRGAESGGRLWSLIRARSAAKQRVSGAPTDQGRTNSPQRRERHEGAQRPPFLGGWILNRSFVGPAIRIGAGRVFRKPSAPHAARAASFASAAAAAAASAAPAVAPFATAASGALAVAGAPAAAEAAAPAAAAGRPAPAEAAALGAAPFASAVSGALAVARAPAAAEAAAPAAAAGRPAPAE